MLRGLEDTTLGTIYYYQSSTTTFYQTDTTNMALIKTSALYLGGYFFAFSCLKNQVLPSSPIYF